MINLLLEVLFFFYVEIVFFYFGHTSFAINWTELIYLYEIYSIVPNDMKISSHGNDWEFKGP